MADGSFKSAVLIVFLILIFLLASNGQTGNLVINTVNLAFNIFRILIQFILVMASSGLVGLILAIVITYFIIKTFMVLMGLNGGAATTMAFNYPTAYTGIDDFNSFLWVLIIFIIIILVL
jgi:hypothetical protein